MAAPKHPGRTEKEIAGCVSALPSPLTAHANETGNVPPETMDETMDDDAKDPGPFQQRNTPAADSEDAAAESMEEAMDGDSHPRTARFPSRTLCPERPLIDAPTTAHEPQQPQQTKAEKRNRQRARENQGQTQTQSSHEGISGDVVTA